MGSGQHSWRLKEGDIDVLGVLMAHTGPFVHAKGPLHCSPSAASMLPHPTDDLQVKQSAFRAR